MKKHKMTGCARLFVALIIIAPLAYLGAAYYNGQDGIQNIKDFFGIGNKQSDRSSDQETYDGTSRDLEKVISEKDDLIKGLEQENAELKKENARLRDQIPSDSLQSGQ